jgi:hypothetical protein
VAGLEDGESGAVLLLWVLVGIRKEGGEENGGRDEERTDNMCSIVNFFLKSKTKGRRLFPLRLRADVLSKNYHQIIVFLTNNRQFFSFLICAVIPPFFGFYL